MLDGLLAVALCLLLVDGDDFIGILLRVIDADVASVPDEVLKELISVLLLNHEASGLNYVTRVLNETLSIVREFPGIDGGVSEDVGEEPVALLVAGYARLAEGLDDAVEAKLAVNVRSLSLLVNRVDDGHLEGQQSTRQAA